MHAQTKLALAQIQSSLDALSPLIIFRHNTMRTWYFVYTEGTFPFIFSSSLPFTFNNLLWDVLQILLPKGRKRRGHFLPYKWLSCSHLESYRAIRSYATATRYNTLFCNSEAYWHSLHVMALVPLLSSFMGSPMHASTHCCLISLPILAAPPLSGTIHFHTYK